MELIRLENTKEQALAVMLKEMENPHSPTEDVIHNWLCDQDEPALFAGILKNGKSIKNSLSFCATRAKKHQTSGNVAMVDDKTVFGWIRDYFLSDDPEPEAITVEVATSFEPETIQESKADKSDDKFKNKSTEEENQLSLFDYL